VFPTWADGPVTDCPVKLFTPDVSEAIEWFHATHELEANGMAQPHYRRVALPRAGAAGEQDAALMDAIDVVAAATDRCVRKAVVDAEVARQEHADGG
jgi:hypothetical protein